MSFTWVGVLVAVVPSVVASPCHAEPALDGAGLFAFPGGSAVGRTVSPAAAPPVRGGGARFGTAMARVVAGAVVQVRDSGISPMFLGFHGLGLTISGQL